MSCKPFDRRCTGVPSESVATWRYESARANYHIVFEALVNEEVIKTCCVAKERKYLDVASNVFWKDHDSETQFWKTG